MAEPSRHLVLYDGVCGLCHRLVRFILARDRQDLFRFAALQSPLATGLLQRAGCDTTDMDTVYVVVDHGAPTERLLRKGRAVVFILGALGSGWRLVARGLSVLPAPLLDWGYSVVAKYRYRVFGRLDQCALPSPHQRAKFIDTGGG